MKRAHIDGENLANDEIVKINAGGKLYYTVRKTLTETFPSSMIARLFSHKDMIPRDEQGNYFIDADPTLFGALLNVLRRPNLVDIVPAGISEETWWLELDYWGVKEYAIMDDRKEEEMPSTLVLKQGLLREKEVAMVKKIKHLDYLIVERMLEWGGFGELLVFFNPSVTTEFYIKAHTIQVDLSKGIICEEGVIPTHKHVCISDYICHYRETFIELLKEVTHFDRIIIEQRTPSEPYVFNGKRYTPVKKEVVLYIELRCEYHNCK